ncbi:CRISPR-associated endonuclease Cas2 [Fusobacterium varium]
MKLLVCYDIIKNNTRNNIVNLLFDFGFQRLQFSVFLGEISKKKIKKLLKQTQQIINNNEDSLYIFNLCEKDFNNCLFLGKITGKQFFNNNFLLF